MKDTSKVSLSKNALTARDRSWWHSWSHFLIWWFGRNRITFSLEDVPPENRGLKIPSSEKDQICICPQFHFFGLPAPLILHLLLKRKCTTATCDSLVKLPNWRENRKFWRVSFCKNRFHVKKGQKETKLCVYGYILWWKPNNR